MKTTVKATIVQSLPWPDDETAQTVLEDGYTIRKDLAAGTMAFLKNQSEEIAAIDYICPCGCGAHGCLPIKKGVKEPQSWLWDGNMEAPTLEPSILRKAGCKWHGYLRNGIFETC